MFSPSSVIQVDYSAEQWLLKNMDPLNENVVQLLQCSQDEFIKMIWKDGMHMPSLPSQKCHAKNFKSFFTVSSFYYT